MQPMKEHLAGRRPGLRLVLSLALLVGAGIAAFAHPATAARDPQQAATAYLQAHAAALGLPQGATDLMASAPITTLGGTVVRYQQMAGAWPVHGGQIVVTLDRSSTVLLVVSAYQPLAAPVVDRPGALDARQAADRALAIQGQTDKAQVRRAEREIIAAGTPGRAVWRVVVEAGDGAAHEVLLDAYSGAVMSSRDLRQFDTGTGQVFNPNPVATSLDPTLRDNDDQDSPALTAQLQRVTLRGLDSRGYLDGEFATTSPSQGTRAFSPQHIYLYTRSDPRFEEVMAYYHVDTTQRYIQSLGFTNVNNRPQPVKADAFSYDNSYYNPSNGRITFGRGGVDDAEDADVILHEYGHAIQDNQVPGFGSSLEAGSMGEAFGDYWAMTNFAQAQPRAWRPIIAEWDATSYDDHVPPYLRRLDLDLHYPQDMAGEVHHDGQIWSRALWDMWNALGKRKADTLILQAHFSLTPAASFRDGAMAIIAADQALNGGRNGRTLERIFADRGIPTQ